MPSLLTHISRYSLASILTTAAGLISFPLFTRILGPSGYGLMALVNATLSLWIGFGKFGLQHAGLRFYSEHRASTEPFALERHLSTLLIGMGALGLLVTGAFALTSQWLPAGWWADPRMPALLLFCAPLIAVRIVDSAGINLLRAREASGTLSIFSVVQRYLVLGLVLAALTLIAPTLEALYGATLVGELVLLGVLLVLVLKATPFRPRRFSPRLLGAMLAFGIPMIGYELAGTLLIIGDRFVIQYFLGAEPLGTYSAAYNLCSYIQAGVVAATVAAVLPAYLRIWESEGAAATRAFIRDSISLYLLLAVPVAAGLAAVGDSLIALLASAAYRPGAAAIPYVISGQVIDGLFVFAAAGLYVHKRALSLTALVGFGAAINLGLNVVMVPAFGLIGAAQATLISYALLVGLGLIFGGRLLRVDLPFARAGSTLVAAVAMWWVVGRIEIERPILELALQVAAGTVIYFAGVAALDGPFRSQAWRLLRRMGNHAG